MAGSGSSTTAGLRARALLAAAAASLALAACESDGTVSLPPCPEVRIVGDLATLTRFRPGEGRDLTDVTLEAEVADFGGECATDPDGGVAGVTETALEIVIRASRGPANDARTGSVRYFVAVAGPDGEILRKGVFTRDFVFEGNRNTIDLVEEREVVLALAEGRRADHYAIYLGFQLTPDERRASRVRPAR